MRDTTQSIEPAGASRTAIPLPNVPGERISYTLQTAAEVVDLSIATLRRLNKVGKLRFFKVGGRTLVCAKSLHALAV